MDQMAASQVQMIALLFEQVTKSTAQVEVGVEDQSEEGRRQSHQAIKVQKMTANDAPEASLNAFESITCTARWPEDHWVAILIP